MQRRLFLTLLGGAAAAWPVSAGAQQRQALPVVGYLISGTPEANERIVAAFRRGLSEAGFVEGRNVAIEYRWTNNIPVRAPELAAELVQRRVAVIATTTANAARAAKAATTGIPIVFFAGGDAVQIGLVSNLARPDSNITGVNSMLAELGAKRLGLLHELLPRAQRFGLLVSSNVPAFETIVRTSEAAATTIGRPLEVLVANTNREIDVAFARAVEKRVDALTVAPFQLFDARRVQLTTLAARHVMPAIFTDRALWLIPLTQVSPDVVC